MIWVGGRIVPDEALTISVRDRTFEHGLGLFETFRTWKGRPTLLDRHLARMTRSAAELGLPLDPTALPDEGAVAELLRANRHEGDAVLRITMTGGTAPEGGAVVWMRSGALPPAARAGGAILDRFWGVAYGDRTAHHKCLNYWHRRLAHDEAGARGTDEALSRTRDDLIWEGSRTNLFLVMGDLVTTPRADGPLVPGIMRGVVLERARGMGLKVGEGEFALSVLEQAHEAFLTNSVRGIVPIRRIRSRRFPAPGPVSMRLWDDILPWLERGGDPAR